MHNLEIKEINRVCSKIDPKRRSLCVVEGDVKAFLEQKKILCYGIIRNWENTQKEEMRINGFEMTTEYGGYPYVRMTDDKSKSIVVQVHVSPSDWEKADTDSMEMGAGYDIYEVVDTEENRFHMYIANDQLAKEMNDMHKIESGDFVDWYKNDLQAFREKEAEKRRVANETRRAKRNRKARSNRKNNAKAGQSK